MRIRCSPAVAAVMCIACGGSDARAPIGPAIRNPCPELSFSGDAVAATSCRRAPDDPQNFAWTVEIQRRNRRFVVDGESFCAENLLALRNVTSPDKRECTNDKVDLTVRCGAQEDVRVRIPLSLGCSDTTRLAEALAEFPEHRTVLAPNLKVWHAIRRGKQVSRLVVIKMLGGLISVELDEETGRVWRFGRHAPGEKRYVASGTLLSEFRSALERYKLAEMAPISTAPSSSRDGEVWTLEFASAGEWKIITRGVGQRDGTLDPFIAGATSMLRIGGMRCSERRCAEAESKSRPEHTDSSESVQPTSK